MEIMASFRYFACKEAIEGFEPDVIGISVKNIDLTHIYSCLSKMAGGTIATGGVG